MKGSRKPQSIETLSIVKQSHISANDKNNFLLLSAATIILFCITVIVLSPTSQITNNLAEPKIPPVVKSEFQFPNKPQIKEQDLEVHPQSIPFEVTKMGPTEVTKFFTGDIMSMSTGESHIVNMETIDGEHPISAYNVDATSIVPIKKPIVELDKQSYTWGDKVYITFKDPFSVKHPDKIETIGGNHNIIISIGNEGKLDCKFRETNHGTRYFSGMITLKWPWDFNTSISKNGLECVHLPNDKYFGDRDNSITISYEYTPKQYATVTAPIE